MEVTSAPSATGQLVTRCARTALTTLAESARYSQNWKKRSGMLRLVCTIAHIDNKKKNYKNRKMVNNKNNNL